MILSLLLAGVLCFNAGSSPASAKIGVVDTDAVFSAYDGAEGISERVRAIALEGLEEREKMRDGISLLERELREKADVLSAREAEKLRNRLQARVQEYRDFDRMQKEREAEPVHEALNRIYERVESYAEANGFDLVFEKRAGLFGRTVLFAVESLDITEEIIKAL